MKMCERTDAMTLFNRAIAISNQIEKALSSLVGELRLYKCICAFSAEMKSFRNLTEYTVDMRAAKHDV